MSQSQVFMNNAVGSVDVQVEIVDTSMQIDATLAAQIAAEVDFATDFILLTLTESSLESTWEIVKVTNLVGQVATIERAQEGTTAAVWPIGSKVGARVTQGSMDRARRQWERLLYDTDGSLLLDENGDVLIDVEV